MVILKLKNKTFTVIDAVFFFEDVNTDNVLVSNKISSSWTNSKHFIGYLYDDCKIKQLHIILPKTSSYVKDHDGKTNWIYFLI